jgi:hypothetical protein
MLGLLPSLAGVAVGSFANFKLNLNLRKSFCYELHWKVTNQDSNLVLVKILDTSFNFSRKTRVGQKNI